MISKIWKDPVWASVIATIIAAIIIGVATNSFDYISGVFWDKNNVTKGDLTGNISVVDDLCTKDAEVKKREVEITLLNIIDIKPKKFNLCGKFEFKDISGKKGQTVSYKAKSGDLEDDGSFLLWDNKTNLVILK